jgi:hydroxysqualene synthase
MKTGVAHEENFPVASWLCPAHLRPVIAAIYWFARTADDMADEGDATADQRLADLETYRHTLAEAALNPDHAPTRWPEVFVPLATHIRAQHLPIPLLNDLLDAFEQDVHRTHSGQRYVNHGELLGYCRLSANPVGRLLLHLYGISDPLLLGQSDHICTALQLINFWQDLSRDLPRQRHYLPHAELSAAGLTHADFEPGRQPTEATRRRMEQLVAGLLAQACEHMQQGASLCCQVPGRAGWELRLVVQGGLRIAEKARGLHHQTWLHRPKLGLGDVPLLLWRAWRMG